MAVLERRINLEDLVAIAGDRTMDLLPLARKTRLMCEGKKKKKKTLINISCFYFLYL